MYGRAFSLALQPDGKIVAAGQDLSGFRLAVARMNADGTTGPTFAGGTAAVGFMPTAVYVAAEAVRVQANGKILVAGTGDGNNLWFTLARFTDGTLDPGFGSGRRVLPLSPSATGQRAEALVLQPDGRVVAAGHR